MGQALPPNKSDRRWRCRPEEAPPAAATVFEGETFYFARNRAAIYFNVDPARIVGELVDSTFVATRAPDHDPWSWLGDADATKQQPGGEDDDDEPEGTTEAGSASAKKNGRPE